MSKDFFNIMDVMSDDEIETKFLQYDNENIISHYVVSLHGKEAAVELVEWDMIYGVLSSDKKEDKNSECLKEIFRRYSIKWEEIDTTSSELSDNGDGTFTWNG